MKKKIGLILLPMMGMLPLLTSAQLVMTSDCYVVLSGGSHSNPTTLVLTNPAPAGISNTGSGWIISENEFNQVDWQIGTNTGTYVVPFGYSTTDYLPVTCQITTAGSGSGSIQFATYHGATWDNSTYEPSDVSTMSDFGAANYSNNAVDRFWIVNASGYGTMPSPNITFTYIRSGTSEIASPNYIVDSTLIAQRFNSSSTKWDDWLGATHTGVVNANTGTVSTGVVPSADFYRSWCVFNDSNLLIPAGVASISSNAMNNVTVYPNPGNGSFNLKITNYEVGMNTTVEVYNALGQKVYSRAIVYSSSIVDLSSEAAGVYLYRVVSGDGNLEGAGKLVIQK